VTAAKPTLLLTRPQAQAERFAAQCVKVLGEVDVVISPVLEVVATDVDVDLARYGGVVLTSENGARMLSARADVAGMQAWCVGDRTATVAKALGMQAVSAGGDATALIDLVKQARPGGVLLHARGRDSRGDVAECLNAAGIRVESRVVYEQRPVALNAAARAVLSADSAVVLPVFSPRTANLLGKEMGAAAALLKIVALSQAVAEAWTGPKPECFTVAEQPDAAHMIRSIATIWSQPLP